MRLCCAGWVLLLALAAGCSPSSDTLASFTSAPSLTLTDLDAHLLSLPEAERQIPPGVSPAEWMEAKLRRLAVERVLESSAEMTRLKADPKTVARRLWLRSAMLASALQRELAREAEPTSEQVAARAEALAAEARNEPVLSFQHIYFRLDLVKTPRQRQSLRERAERVAALARTDADFSALVREHSDSADAATGGLVVNTRPSDLDEESRRALEGLAENQVSPVIETRTGLHVFRLLRRLVPEPPSAQQLTGAARRLLLRDDVTAAQEELVQKLRQRVDTQIETSPWTLGSWRLDDETIGQLLPDRAGEEDRQRLVERFLLAEEAIARGLESPQLEEELARRWRAEQLEHLFNERRSKVVAVIEEERLRSFFEAQPALFNATEKVHLELIFVPQGVDSFATQKQVEAHVAALENGASFADLAKRLSRGPGAQNGGDLGLLAASEWSQLGPAVSAVVPTLEVGEISKPIYCTDRILTQQPWMLRGGFAVLRVRDRVPERERSFEEAIDDVRRAYAAERQAELDQAVQTQLLDEAGFKILRLPDPNELVVR